MAVLTLACVAATLAAVAYLAATDPKRRRVFGAPALEQPRRTTSALAGIVLPGLLLLVVGNGAGFIIWLGAVTVAGWGVAAISPPQAARLRAWLLGAAARSRHGLAGATSRLSAAARAMTEAIGALRQAMPRIAALERRVAELEAELARFKEPPARAGAVGALESGLADLPAEDRTERPATAQRLFG